MKHRWKRLWIFVWTMTAMSLGGCSLARGELQSEEMDKLVGVFLTEEYVNTGEMEIEMNRKGEITLFREEEIPGKLVLGEVGGPDIIFEGIQGFGIYSVDIWDESEQMFVGYTFADERFANQQVTESNEKMKLEATVYVEDTGIYCGYFNPVYQTPEGEIYMKPGSSISAEMVHGMSMSQTLTEENRINKNGEEIIEGIEICVHITYQESGIPTRIVCYDDKGDVADIFSKEEILSLLEKEQYELILPAEAAYLIAESQTGEGETIRALYNHGEESLYFLRSMGNGYLKGAGFTLIWNVL